MIVKYKTENIAKIGDVMKSKELLSKRIQLFRDSANFVKPERIPHFANVVTWKVFDAGYKLSDAMTNFDVMKDCVVKFLDKYTVDGLMDTGIRNQFNVTEAFSPISYYYYDDDAVGIRDHAHCTVDTLKDYIADPERYIWEKILPEKFGETWSQIDKGTWKRAFNEYMKYIKYILSISSVTKEYAIPSLAPNNPMTGTINFAVEELEANLLGIQQLSVAMRRNKEELLDFIEKWDSEKIGAMVDKVMASEGANYKYCFDASVLMLAHNLMNTKQFEEFYLPSLSKLLSAYETKKMNARVFTEGSIMRFCDYFGDYSKGTLTFHIENDDPYELRKQLPNVAIMGGLDTDLLSRGTKEECIDRVKELADGLASNGGFILSEGKMLSYRNDANSENYKAICDFMNSDNL